MGKLKLMLVTLFLGFLSSGAMAAGTFSTNGDKALEIKQHQVEVLIQNGFAKVRVNQAFYNTSALSTEGHYRFPLPEGAVLSEVELINGEDVITGEVLAKNEAEDIYHEEKSQGKSVSVAQKNGHNDFTFSIANIEAKATVNLSFVYYQQLNIDTGMARFAYPLQEPQREEAESFWSANNKVEDLLEIVIEVKSSWSIAGVRSPGYLAKSEANDFAKGIVKQNYEFSQATLDKDFVFYYRLQDDLPGRIEVIPYKKSVGKEGTFMMVVTPGVDLKPLDGGKDYLFILDISGSMRNHIRLLNEAVIKSLSKLNKEDRFRIFTFNGSSHDFTGSWQESNSKNVKYWSKQVGRIRADGGTDLYKGLATPLKTLNADRVCNVILVTDAVANKGELRPGIFMNLLKKQDIRLFSFLIGNGGNWPLMKKICHASGGFYQSLSSSDDIIGKVLQAGEKVAYESMHDAQVSISGRGNHQLTQSHFSKIYRGQQLVMFGRYNKSGEKKFTLEAHISGQKKVYETTFDMPEVALENPELERLWALHYLEKADMDCDLGKISASDYKELQKEIGTNYQIVTDETSMIVADDTSFAKRGIERRNLKRSQLEHRAQVQKQSAPTKNYRVDKKKRGFRLPSPSVGRSGGGALSPWFCLFLLIAAGYLVRLKRKNEEV